MYGKSIFGYFGNIKSTSVYYTVIILHIIVHFLILGRQNNHYCFYLYGLPINMIRNNCVKRDVLLWSCRHNWTAFSCTVLCDGTVKHVDLIEEIHSYKMHKEISCNKNIPQTIHTINVHT